MSEFDNACDWLDDLDRADDPDSDLRRLLRYPRLQALLEEAGRITRSKASRDWDAELYEFVESDPHA